MRKRARRKKSRAHAAYSKANPLPPIDWKPLFELVSEIFKPRIVQVSIPEEMFRKLLMLCHPDKHGNSETSTEVTRWLLMQRDLQKEPRA